MVNIDSAYNPLKNTFMRSATMPYETILEKLRPTLEEAKRMLTQEEKEELIKAIGIII